MTIVERFTRSRRSFEWKPQELTSENVGTQERLLSVLVGGCTLLDGLRRRSAVGLLEGILGVSLLHRGSSGYSWLYDVLDIDTARQRQSAASIRVKRTVTIDRDPQSVYSLWRHFENLPRFFNHLESVSVLDDKRLHWIIRGPLGRKIEYNVQIVEDVPGKYLAWRSEEGAPLRHTGAVSFSPLEGGRATEVKVSLQFEPSGVILREVILKLFGDDPRGQIRRDLERFKRIVEGEFRPESRTWQQESPHAV